MHAYVYACKDRYTCTIKCTHFHMMPLSRPAKMCCPSAATARDLIDEPAVFQSSQASFLFGSHLRFIHQQSLVWCGLVYDDDGYGTRSFRHPSSLPLHPLLHQRRHPPPHDTIVNASIQPSVVIYQGSDNIVTCPVQVLHRFGVRFGGVLRRCHDIPVHAGVNHAWNSELT